MSNSGLIEIVSVSGEGFAFGPASLQGAGERLTKPPAADWNLWLQKTFAGKFAEQAGHWEAILTSVGPWQPVQAPRLTFSRVAGFIHKGELQAWRLPIPADPPETSAAVGSAAASMRSQTPVTAPVKSSDAGTPQPKGAATEDMGQDAANLQCMGDPVAPTSGEEILILQDFSVRAPMPLVWQRWYRSRNSDRDLGLGAGWFAECLRLIWQDDDATWLLDHEARPVRMPLLAPGEIAWQAVGGQRLERKHDDRMMLTERDGRVWVLVPDNRGSWRPTSVQDAAGHQWLFFYDARQRLWRLDFSPHRRLQFSYGEDDLLRQVSLHSGDLDQDESPGQELAVYEYDRHANLIAATTSTGTERYSYYGNLLASRELPSGYRFLFHWDGIGPQARCLRTHGEDGRYDFRFDYQPDRLLTRVTDAFGNEQVFHYDDQGRIVARQDPDGGTHQWQYNHRGQLLAYRLPDGRTTQYGFDAQGQPVLVRLPDGREHRRVFNTLGFCTGERLPDGRQIQREFDLLGRLLREQRADGSHWQYHYDDNGWLSEACSDAGEVHRTGFDAEGYLLAHEERGALNRYVFDEQGRLTGHLNQDLITEYEYHSSHLSAIHQYPEQAPQQRQSRHYRYDSAGRLTDFTTATGESHGYDYDDLARPIRYRRPDGKSVAYQYDKAQRLTDVVRADGSQWALSYNSKGEISACEAPDGRRIAFRYDAAGDIVHREQGADWAQHIKRDAGGRVVQQSSQGRDRVPVTKQFYYDRLGRRIGASCADRRLQWQYDVQGRVVQHQQDEHAVAYHYGPGQRLDSLQLPDGTTISFTYDRQGRWNFLSVNGETRLQRQFDDQGREQACEAGRNRRTQVWDRHNRLITRRWQGQTTCVRRYSWDAESRLEQYTDSKDGTRQFHRDPQGQLIADAEQTFQYDDGGNRVTDETRIEQDRLLENETTKRRYDTLGAEVEVRGPQIQQRRFDAEGQLVDLKQAGLHVQYGYDALGRRAWRKSEDGTTTYLWHNDVLLGEQSPDGQWQWYIRDPDTDAPLTTLINGQPYYYELDWRGMPIRLWAEDGSLVWQARADAWGQCQAEGEVHQPIRLPGQFEDELTGLHFNRFRDYDPATGRYLTPDPLGIKGGLNSYRYTPNPVDYDDPLGLSSCSESAPGPDDAVAGEMAPVTEDAPGLQNIELANSIAMLARQPAPPPVLTPFPPNASPLGGLAAVNDAAYAARQPLASPFATGATVVAGTAATGIAVGHLAMGPGPALQFSEPRIETVQAPDGVALEAWTVQPLTDGQKHDMIVEHMDKAHGAAYAREQASGMCTPEMDDGTREFFANREGLSANPLASQQDDVGYRTWLANGGEGSLAAWKAEGKPLATGILPQSIASSAPGNAMDNNKAVFGSSNTNNYKRTFFNAYPQTKGKVVVHHAVEQQVQTRYPGVVSDSEMHSIENLRGIPKEVNSDIHLSKIRKEWNKFYRKNPKPTKQDLLDKATEIDNIFGVQFNPPIR